MICKIVGLVVIGLIFSVTAAVDGSPEKENDG